MAEITETAPASPTTAPTATTTAQAAPVVVPETEGREVVDAPKATKPVNAFKRMSGDELAAIREDFSAKVHAGHKIVGEMAMISTPKPVGDTLPIAEDAPAATAPETPAATPTPAAVEPVVEPEIDPETGEPLEIEPVAPAPNGKAPQRRLRAQNPVDDMALSLYRKAGDLGKPISLAAAEAKAKEILGVTDAVAAPEAKSPDALRAELTELRVKRKEARASFDEAAIEAAEDAVEDKLLDIQRAERDAVFQRQHEQSQVAQIETTARAEAARLYPDLKNDGKEGRAESEMHKAARQIHAQLVESGDPSVNEPDYLLDLARRAAKVTSTAPSTVTVAAKPKPAVSRPSVTPPAKPPLITSGSARTSPTSQVANLKVGIQKATPRQLEAITDQLRDRLASRR